MDMDQMPWQDQFLKILVVDDEPSFHKLLTAKFRKDNFEIISCLKSKEAIPKIREISPDLVLMDLMMPDEDGLSLTRRIRQVHPEPYLPIIVVTAKQSAKDVREALEAGADDYIKKPFDFEELEARINNIARLKTLQDSLLSKTAELDNANSQITQLNQSLSDANKQLKKKVYDLHNIFEVSWKVMGQTEIETLVSTALLNVLGIFTAKSAMLLLVDPDDEDSFSVIQSKGIVANRVKGFAIKREDKLIEYLDIIKRPFLINEIDQEFKDSVPLLKDLGIQGVAPLYQEGEIMGILCLGPSVTGSEFPLDALEILGIVTNMLSVALHNAQNFDQIKALSYTDGMTGLHNYRFFTMRLKEEIARSRRNELQMALLILDVDFFKNYNDTLGHPAGDEVLRQLSSILRSTIRDNDIVARYGGEEFAIILPSTGREGAIILAERLRDKIEKFHFSQEEIQPNGRLTISIGVAIYPDNSLTLEDLIVAADRALYFAKESGRNKVIVFSDVAI
jgi:two-component system cell cycle response regulator